jgi:hypothetical protein
VVDDLLGGRADRIVDADVADELLRRQADRVRLADVVVEVLAGSAGRLGDADVTREVGSGRALQQVEGKEASLSRLMRGWKRQRKTSRSGD